MNLVELVLATHRTLDGNGRAHAFGGALALAYYADPRATVDIDVNVFVAFDETRQVVDELAAIDLTPERPAEDWLPIAGVRLRQQLGLAVVDLFPSLDAVYEDIRARTQALPFGPDEVQLPFLAVEDLTAFKLSFGRAKDWLDVTQIVKARPDLDVDLIEQTLLALRGPHMNPRIARLRAIAGGREGQPPS